MQKHTYIKMGLVAGLAVMAASVQVRAADMAWASGVLADIAVAATEANEALADAAVKGKKSDDIKEAQQQAATVETAAEEALAAYEVFAASGATDADAQKALEAARDKAIKAAGGKVAKKPAPVEKDDQLPNPHTVLWQSDELQALYKDLFNIANAASAQGGAEFAEKDHDFTSI